MIPSDAPASPVPSVGTDVVDLTDPRCPGKAADRRFLDRVLADPERRVIEELRERAAPPPDGHAVSSADLALWRTWALKEAAYKAVTGVLGTPPIFEHRAFVVGFAGAVDALPESRGGASGSRGHAAATGPLDAVVRWRGRSVRGRIVDAGENGPVHAVAHMEADGVRERAGSPEPLRWGRALLTDDATVPADRLTERERRSVHSPASAQVRLHARRDLAAWVGVAEADLEIVCDEGPAGRMPPRVLLEGEPAPWSVGLSHHGRWLAWVLGRAK